MTDEQRCGTCKFWYLRNCRRHPPVCLPIGERAYERVTTEWPETDDADWCGEWQAKADASRQ